MKKFPFALGLLLFLTAACQDGKEDIRKDEPVPSGPSVEVNSVSILLNDPKATKTSLGYDPSTETFKCLWQEGDKAFLTDRQSSAEFTMEPGCAGNRKGVFSGKAGFSSEAGNIVAVYPAEAARLTSGGLQLTIPSQQYSGTEGKADIKMASMDIEGIRKSNTLIARNQTCIYQLSMNLPGSLGGEDLLDEKLLSVTLQSQGAHICGNATVNQDSKVSGWDGDEVRYEFGTGTKAEGRNMAIVMLAPSNFTDEASTRLNIRIETTNYNIDLRCNPSHSLEAGKFLTDELDLSSPSWRKVDAQPLENSQYHIYLKDPEHFTPSEPYNVHGVVTDEKGKGIPGVQVSDGYVVTKTDEAGEYRLFSEKTKPSKSHGYVFITLPGGYEPELDGVFPHIWDRLAADDSRERHDFTLRKVDNTDHVVLVLGDFHLCNRNALYDIKQFAVCAKELNEQIEHYRGLGRKVYVITLGDMTWDLYWDDNQGLATCNFDLPAYRKHINGIMTSVPFFHTMGNHDYDYSKSGDWETAKPYKQHIGPTYYSFNLGGFHYIVLDNVISKNDGTVNGRGNSMSINNDQIEWVKKDMANVPAGVPVIVTMHEQVYHLSSISSGSVANSSVSSLNSAIGSSHRIHYITADTHIINNYGKPSDQISEHNAGAVCGDWWWSGRLTWKGVLPAFDAYKGKSYFMQARDGAPSGYTIYEMSGSSWKNQWKGFGLPLEKQFKTYDRNQIQISSTIYPGTGDCAKNIDKDALSAGYYNSSSANYVYMNIWNWDPSWTITVHDSGSDKNLPVSWMSRNYDPMSLITYNAGRYAEGSDGTSTFKANSTMFHICRVTASSASSTLTITVKDGFGRTYTETMKRPKPFTIDWD